MKKNSLLNRSLIVCSLLLLSVTLSSQVKTEKNDIKPVEGQAGKNVPWIPTPTALVEKMLNIAKITPKDYLIDLGSGDGRMVITAARRGTRSLGVEYNPDLVKLSKKNAEKEGLTNMAQFIEADIFEVDFSKATVITMFLLPEINMRLRPKLLNLKPGTRIVSNTFTMQEWQPDVVAEAGEPSGRWVTAYLWIVPAKVNGKWAFSQGGELTLIQEFQMLSGSLKTGNKTVNNISGKLNGNEITFTANGTIYTGTIAGNKMTGTLVSGGNSGNWSATR